MLIPIRSGQQEALNRQITKKAIPSRQFPSNKKSIHHLFILTEKIRTFSCLLSMSQHDRFFFSESYPDFAVRTSNFIEALT